LGAIKVWVTVLVGWFILGAAYLFMEPMFAMISNIALQNGVDRAYLDLIEKMFEYSPILMAVSLLIYGIIGSIRSEEGSQTIYQRW
jgi:hypothetical protein